MLDVSQFRFSQSYLKILVDTGNPLWKATRLEPKSTTAPESSEPDGRGWMVGKVVASLNILGSSIGMEANRSGTKSKTAERLPRDCIVQRERQGTFWWDFHIDEQQAKVCGVELTKPRLPAIRLEYMKNGLVKPDQLMVEISSFWSRGLEGAQQVFANNRLPLPGYSNLCQDLWFDLAPIDADDNFVGTHSVWEDGKENFQVDCMSGMVYTPGLRKPLILQPALEGRASDSQ